MENDKSLISINNHDRNEANFKNAVHELEQDKPAYVKKGPQVLDQYTQRTACNMMLYSK